MKKLLTLFALVAVAVFGMYACDIPGLSSSNDSSGNTLVNMKIDILSNTAPQGTSPGKLVVRQVFSHCDTNGTVVNDTSIDTSFYSIAGGKLFLWNEGDCVAGSLSGTSTTIIGTWTSSTGLSGDNPGDRVLVPSTYRASNCPSTLPADSSSNDLVIENATTTLTIAQTSASYTIGGTICFAQVFVDGDSAMGLPVSKSTCNSVELTASGGKKVTITSGYQSGKVSLGIAYDGKSCNSSVSMNFPGTTPDCSMENGNPFEDTTFQNCVTGLGYYSNTNNGLAKMSASSATRNLRWHHR